QQRSAPGAPNARQTDPEQPIETGQHRSFPLSPEGSELQVESSVFDSNGLVSAQQETNESNHRQKKGWHVSRLFAFIRFEVNLLWPDGVMAKDRQAADSTMPRANAMLLPSGDQTGAKSSPLRVNRDSVPRCKSCSQ